MWHLRLREVAIERGYTIAKLERITGMDIKSVRKLWHMPNSNTTLATLARLAHTLDVPLTHLIGDDKMNVYQREDFYSVPAHTLQIGNEIGLNVDLSTFYAIRIDDLTRVEGETISAEFQLPIGACLSSNEDVKIDIGWKGDIPIISVFRGFTWNSPVLILSSMSRQ